MRKMCQELFGYSRDIEEMPIHVRNACLALAKKFIYKFDNRVPIELNLSTNFQTNGLIIFIFVPHHFGLRCFVFAHFLYVFRKLNDFYFQKKKQL